MNQFKPAKNKETYTNGISYSQEAAKETKQPKVYEEWSILTPFGDLIGFIKIEEKTELPNEIWIRDKKYKMSDKISKL